ncbi:Na+/H+ antiporter subunit E [Mariniluteicoccus endophyticus]
MSPLTRTLRRLQPGPMFLLAVVWVLLWGRLTWATAIGGLLVGAAILVVFPLPPLSLGLRVRPWSLLVLFLRFNVDLVVASCRVAYAAVAPWSHPRGGLVPVTLRCSDDLFAVITAEMTALVPGTIVIDLDPERRHLLLHVFDLRDEDESDRVRERVLAQEQRVLKALAAHYDQLVAQPAPEPDPAITAELMDEGPTKEGDA